MKEILATTLISLLLVSGYYYNNQANQSDFERWALQNGKFFVGDEKLYREQIYNKNKKMIDQHNKDETQTYKMGENLFMTLTKEEFRELYLGKPSIEEQKLNGSEIRFQSQVPEVETLQSTIDWSKHSSVKNQLQCSTGWAFSITNQIEAYFSINERINLPISAQQIFDCSEQQYGCNDSGNNMEAAIQVLNYGYDFAHNYPYVGSKETCKKKKGDYHDVKKYQSLKELDNIKYFLQTQPVSVGVDAYNMQFYGSGIFSNCKTLASNHYVLLVGYDSDDVWKIQNSWGIGWGEWGYIRLAPGNTCGLKNNAFALEGPYNLL